MIGKIKSWWSERADGVGKNLNSEIKDRIANMFLEENGDKIRKMILQDKNFADKVYNAIVLKKADKI